MTPTDNPNWRESANCATTDPELFFPRKSGSAHTARTICAMCTVPEECLTDALLDSVQQGIRAGMTGSQRRRMMQTAGIATAAKGAA